jgi:hypothetical protein
LLPSDVRERTLVGLSGAPAVGQDRSHEPDGDTVSRLVVTRATDGASAALVASWLLDELAAFAEADIALIDLSTIELLVPSEPARARIEIVLTQARFRGWSSSA